MTDSRDNVLAAIDRQLRLGTLAAVGRLEHPGAPPRRGRRLRGDLVAQLHARAGSAAGHGAPRRGRRSATARVLALLEERGASRVLAWDAEWLNCPGLSDAIAPPASSLEPCWLPADAAERAARLAAIDDVMVGLTGALAGLADTGSLASSADPAAGASRRCCRRCTSP